jgi:hypothetical protein
MGDYEVGYGKPPRQTRFQPGVSANPKGRPKRKPLPASDVISNGLNAPAEYTERGRTKRTTRLALTLKSLGNAALKGDVKAAEMLLKLRAHAQRFGDVGVHKIMMDDWLPDRPGQTAEQKTRETGMQAEAQQAGWWQNGGGSDKAP